MKPRHILAFLITSLICISCPVGARASDGGIFSGDSILAGTVVDHDAFLFGQNIQLAGTVNGNVFIIGNQVLVTGIVNGSLIVIAQNASVAGTISGAVYALALTVDIQAGGLVERDLYSATVSLTSGEGSSISRHLFALGLDAGLSGEVGGELHTAIGPIQLYNGLMRLLGFEELTLELHFELPSSPTPQGSSTISLRHLRIKLLEPLPAFDWGEWGLDVLRSWGTLFLFGLLAIALFRGKLKKAGEPLISHPIRTILTGLLVFVISMNLFVVAVILFVLFFSIGLGFNIIGLWQIAVTLWIILFAGLVVAVLGLAIFIAYGTKLITVYVSTSWVIKRFSNIKTGWFDILALFAGTILYALCRSISYAGWIIDLLVTSAGFGAAWFAWQGARKLQIQNPARPAKVGQPKKN